MRDRFNQYLKLSKDENRGALNKVLVLILIQLLLLGAFEFLAFADGLNKGIASTILAYAICADSLAVLVFILRLVIGTRDRAIRQTQDVYTADIQQMLSSIRGQKQDFINHLNAIHSMVQSGQIDNLQKYAQELVQETRQVSEIVNHRFPALAAFMQAKTTTALEKNIIFTFELPEQQNTTLESSIRTIDMIRILGNLVNNAFDEVAAFPADQRRVHASVRYENENVMLEVSNRGRVLTEADKKKIFTPGYSTKSEGQHSGLGLAIVLERTRHYGGSVDLTSDDMKGTSFKVKLPMEPHAAG